MNPFVQNYLQWTEELESSELYLTWGAYAVMAANLGRRAFFRLGFREVYPNLYAVLVGPSAGARKGLSFDPIQRLTFRSRIKSCPQKISSTEAFIDLMDKTAWEDFTCPVRGHVEHNNLACFSEELIVFLRTGPHNVQFVGDLTDLYDARPPRGWVYHLLKRPEGNSIPGAVFTLFGATSPEHLKEIFPGKLLSGGFSARTIFVGAQRKRKSNAEDWDPNDSLENALIAALIDMRQRIGLATPDKAAKKWYKNWYEEQDRRIAAGDWPVNDPMFYPYCDRRGLHLRKLSLLNAVANGRLEMQLPDYEEALALLERTESQMHLVSGGRGSAPLAELTFQVREWLRIKRGATRSETMRAFPNDLDASIMDRVANTLNDQGLIRIEHTGRGTRYLWREE